MELKLFPFFLLLSQCMYVAAEPASQCLESGPDVRSPFWLTGQNRTGYPGFDLSCNAGSTIINLPSGPFIVREIDYIAREIRINDPDFACLPERVLSLDLSGTLFRGAFYQEFSFFSCSSGRQRPELQPISCLSNSTRSVFATSVSPAVRSGLFGSCDLVKTVSVPVRFPGFGEVPSSSLDQDIVLQWEFPRELNNSSSLEIDHHHQEPFWFRHWRAILVSYAVLAYLTTCFWVSRIISRSGGDSSDPVAPYHQDLSIIIIESDPISEHELELPSPDGPSCSICLSGFRPRETPKALHPCQHSFHARCIDIWLPLNPTCPLCRCRAVSQHMTVTVM